MNTQPTTSSPLAAPPLASSRVTSSPLSPSPLAPSFADLSDADLLATVAQLARCEAQATADLVASLAEVDLRRLYLEQGFSSLFAYCVQHLHLGEGATANRIEAARAVRRFPLILERLRAGAVTLTAIRLLAPHLTEANHREVLDAAHHASRARIEQLVAQLNPRPDVPSVVRKLPARRTPADSAAAADARTSDLRAFGRSDVLGGGDSRRPEPVNGTEPGERPAGAALWATNAVVCRHSDGTTAAPRVAEDRGAPSVGKDGAARPPSADQGLTNERWAARRPSDGVTVGPSVSEDRAARPSVGEDRAARARSGSIVSPAAPLSSDPSSGGSEPGAGTAETVAPSAHPRPTARVAPLAPERYKVQMTIGPETHAKLRRAQDLLRHTIPNGDVARIFDEALTLLVDRLERRKLGAAKHPRMARSDSPSGPKKGAKPRKRSRHIPAAVKRAVWRRDAGRCCYVGENGHVCGETKFLEYHHRRPIGDGGETTVENTALYCRGHNQREGERYFGFTREPASAIAASASGRDPGRGHIGTREKRQHVSKHAGDRAVAASGDILTPLVDQNRHGLEHVSKHVRGDGGSGQSRDSKRSAGGP